MMRKLLCVLSSVVLLAGSVSAAEWGNLKGKIVVDGTVPAAPKINVTKDVEFCGKFDLVDESVVVGEGGGLANAVIYLMPGRGQTVDVHESYQETADAKVELDNNDCRFEPHVVTLRTTQTLVVGNKDSVGHNTKIDCLSNAPINPIVPANTTMEQQFSKEERLPVTVSCNIHPWMNARLVVKDHPYMAVTDKEGNFEIANLPAGTWEFQFWHETPGYLQDVTLDGKKTNWRRGRVELTIAAGDNDLGTIQVPAASMK